MGKTKVLVITLLVLSSVAEGRNWRAKGRASVNGDFVDVSGQDVRIETKSGVEEIPYSELSRGDQAYVKSTLQSRGRSEDAARLNRRDNGSSAETSQPDPDQASEEKRNSGRTWRDVNGNSLTGESRRVAPQAVVTDRGEDCFAA